MSALIGTKPIIYCTKKVYSYFIKAEYSTSYQFTSIREYIKKIVCLIGWKQVRISCNTSAKLWFEWKLQIACSQSFIPLDFLLCVSHVN